MSGLWLAVAAVFLYLALTAAGVALFGHRVTRRSRAAEMAREHVRAQRPEVVRLVIELRELGETFKGGRR